MNIVLVGLNHRTAPVALREQLALADCGLRMALDDLAVRRPRRSNGNRLAVLTNLLQEAVILSTCNRLEIYAVVKGDSTSGWHKIENFLAELQGIPIGELHPYLYFLEGPAAAEHLMRVASGLDSMILGEPQIQGQVSNAILEARAAGATGPVLSHLFDLAVHAGKRARTETAIGRHTTSVSHAAAQLVSSELGDIKQLNVLVIGAGEMAEVAAQALLSRGLGQLSFINRTYARAESMADQFEGQALNWYHLSDALVAADAVVTATGAPHIVVHVDDVSPILPERAGRPLLFVDIAVPRDVEEEVGSLPDVRRYDIDHLKSAVDTNLAQRQQAVPAVEVIIAEELERFEQWLQGRQVLPVLVELRRKANLIAASELELYQNKLDKLDPSCQENVEQMVHRIVNKLLHEPTVRLKASAADGNGIEYAHAIRDLFALDEVAEDLAPSSNGQKATANHNALPE